MVSRSLETVVHHDSFMPRLELADCSHNAHERRERSRSPIAVRQQQGPFVCQFSLFSIKRTNAPASRRHLTSRRIFAVRVMATLSH
jgi:hypothetical protein